LVRHFSYSTSMRDGANAAASKPYIKKEKYNREICCLAD